MQGKYVQRILHEELLECLAGFPAVALLGPRQCGKSTLAKNLIRQFPDSVYLDLELPSDAQKLTEPELFFSHNSNVLICLDEIQRSPELFAPLRAIIDLQGRNGQFLLLGSASRDLIKQSSESLAGRIAYLELAPFSMMELIKGNVLENMNDFWLRGGFPDSFLAKNEKASLRWRANFIRTFLEKDIPQLGFRIPANTLHRLWQMCAHSQGQLLNSSKLGSALGVSHTTLRSYIDLLAETFMLRILQPFNANVKKRLVKAPKVYIRDSGILHSLLQIDSYDNLLGHPVFGASWESMVIENIVTALPDWQPFFYRTSAGAEIDLLLIRGQRTIAIECKASKSPKVSRGFWSALEDIDPDEVWIIAPVDSSYPFRKDAMVSPLDNFLEKITIFKN